MDRKMMRSYLFGKRVKFQFEQLVKREREYDAIAEMHADLKDKG